MKNCDRIESPVPSSRQLEPSSPRAVPSPSRPTAPAQISFFCATRRPPGLRQPERPPPNFGCASHLCAQLRYHGKFTAACIRRFQSPPFRSAVCCPLTLRPFATIRFPAPHLHSPRPLSLGLQHHPLAPHKAHAPKCTPAFATALLDPIVAAALQTFFGAS